MAKTVKIFLVLALLVSAAGFIMCGVSAQQSGLTLAQLAEKVKDNIKELNMSSMLPEYSEVRETLTIEPEKDVRQVIISSSFPDLSIRPGSEFRVSLYGDASTELGDLLSWKQTGSAVYLNIANVFNESPSSTGLYAEIVIPQEMMQTLKVTTVSGSMDLKGIKSETLDAASKSGDVMVSNSRLSQVLVRTGSGEILLEHNSSLEVDAESADGRISLIGEGFSGRAKTRSGLIRADLEDLNGDLTLSSAAGNLDIFYSGTDLSYDLSAPSGWVVVRHGDHRHEVKGTIGRGSHRLKGDSASGSITFEHAGTDEGEV